MDDEHTPRPDDHLVEPMYEALHGPEGEQEAASAPEGDAGPEDGPERRPGRGCLGLLLGLLSLTALLVG